MAARLYPERPVSALGRVMIDGGDLAIWFLFQGEPFDVARVYGNQGEFRGYYVDALEPVAWSATLSVVEAAGVPTYVVEPLVDLFLDLWISPDGQCEVLDENELREAERKQVLSTRQADLARRTIFRLVSQVGSRRFPPADVVEFDLTPAELGSYFRETRRIEDERPPVCRPNKR